MTASMGRDSLLWGIHILDAVFFRTTEEYLVGAFLLNVFHLPHF